MTKDKKRIVFIPSWYPSKRYPYGGTFYRDRAQLLSLLYDIQVVMPVGRGIRSYYLRRELSPEARFIENPSVLTVKYPYPAWKRSTERNLKRLGDYGARALGKLEESQGQIDCILGEGWSAAIWASE